MTRLIVKGEDFQKKAISSPLKAIPLPVRRDVVALIAIPSVMSD